MTRNRFHAPLAGAAALAGALVLGTSSMAATTPVLPQDVNANPRGSALEIGTSNWVLSSGASSKLKSSGVTVKGLGSGDTGTDVKGSKILFAAEPKGTTIDPTTMKGTVVTDGGLSFKGKSKTAKLTDITLQPGIENNVTAKLGKKLIELGSLKGGKAVFTHQAQGDLKGATLKLSAAAAKKLNAATGGGFKSGSFATVAIMTITRELPIVSGTAKLTLDPGLVSTITGAGFTISGDKGATVAGNVVSIPLTSGTFDPEELTGRFSLDGTVVLSNGSLSVSLFGWRTILTATQRDLYANINDGVAAPIANLDLSALQAGTNDDGTFYGTGGKLTLSKVASQVLTSNFGINEPAGTVMGVVDISGTLAGKQ